MNLQNGEKLLVYPNIFTQNANIDNSFYFNAKRASSAMRRGKTKIFSFYLWDRLAFELPPVILYFLRHGHCF
jgi:hypothetical protein